MVKEVSSQKARTNYDKCLDQMMRFQRRMVVILIISVVVPMNTTFV